MGKYLGRFAAIYVALIVLMIVVGEILDRLFADGGSGAISGVAFVAPMLAASSAGVYFFKDRGRLPDAMERRYLTNWSFLITLGISVIGGVVMVIGLLMIDPDYVIGLSAAFLIFVAVLVLISLAACYAMLWFGYGWMTTRQVDGLRKREQRKAARGL